MKAAIMLAFREEEKKNTGTKCWFLHLGEKMLDKISSDKFLIIFVEQNDGIFNNLCVVIFAVLLSRQFEKWNG